MDFTLDYIADRYRGMNQLVGTLVAQLAKAGVRVTPRANSLVEFRKRVSEAKQTELFLVSWLTITGDAAGTLNILTHTPIEGSGRYSGYSDPELDRLLEAAFEKAPDERRVVLRAVAEKIRRDVVVIPLYRQRDLYAFSEDLAFRPRLDRRIRAFDMRWVASSDGGS